MGVVTLTCGCGLKMKAPGAVPGRIGKCPRCGSMLKVPDGPAPVATPPGPRPSRPTFIGSRTKKLPPQRLARQQSDGLVRPPTRPESRLFDSLTYPLWNASGLGLLAFLPPLLVFATMPLFAIVPMLTAGLAVALIGVVWMVPQILLLLVVVGYALLFLGRVLTTSASGETMQPRAPSWDLSEIGRGLGRWFWALLVGGVVGGLPPLAYWIGCGEVDWLDRIILVDLIVPGMAYAQMALLAALVHDSPLAANPFTVALAIYRVGWGYLVPCLFTGSCLLILAFGFYATLQITGGFLQLLVYWTFWVAALYVAMVVLRRLGLFCFRHAVILEWFPDRSERPETVD